MATKYLINNVRAGTFTYYAGTSYDTVSDASLITRLEASGGVLLISTAGLVAAAEIATLLRSRGAPAEESAMVMLAGAVQSVSGGAVPTTTQVIAGNGLTGGGALSGNVTLNVGAGSGITSNANDVAVTFGITGEMAASGVAAANSAGVAVKSAPIDHVHAHGAQLIGDGTNHAVATASFAGFMSAADKTKLDSVQTGTGTLVAGTATISNVTITANSSIIISMRDPGAGAITGFADFEVPAASRVVGAGTGAFTVNAIDDAKALINTAVCTFDYIIAN